MMISGLSRIAGDRNLRYESINRGHPTTWPQSRVCNRPQVPCIITVGKTALCLEGLTPEVTPVADEAASCRIHRQQRSAAGSDPRRLVRLRA